MKTLTLKRHLTESFKSLRRNGWMSVAAISAVTVTLLLVGVLLSVLLNINKVAHDVERDVQVRVVINRGTNKEQIKQIKADLTKIKAVKKIKFSSRKQELKNVIGVYGDDFRLFQGDSNPLYDVYIVETNSPDQTIKVAKQAKKIKNVYDARYGGVAAKKLFKAVAT
ncbi:MAG: permease-like cell division protein FtsX, partial [Ligilactobacillus agilis]|nr:permease-like cell division protein FtsX [Ligilactobacillus agilis]